MISRKTTLHLAGIYSNRFARTNSSGGNNYLHKDHIYEYLYANDYEAWFCNLLRSHLYSKELKQQIMQLHTGESLVNVTADWDWEKRRALGQTYLIYLAEDHLKWHNDKQTDRYYYSKYAEDTSTLITFLELDGYLYREGSLLFSEADVLNVREEVGILEVLHSELHLAERAVAFEFLKLSEEHYRESRWSDSIANSRKFLESVLEQVASAFSSKYHNIELSESIRSRPVEVREFLVTEKLLEKKEREALDKVYGLLSHTGSHPYMAEKDQARLLRQMSLLFSQFVMLRFEGKTKTA